MASRRANTSRHAILGVLGFCPMSGYDVKKLIERSIAHFWNESYGQIYPILNRLKRRNNFGNWGDWVCQQWRKRSRFPCKSIQANFISL